MSRPEFIAEQTALAPRTTLQLGGPARYFATCETAGEICTALEWAKAAALPVQILGGGSNVIFPDEGYDGLVLKIGLQGIEFSGDTASAAAGEDWARWVATCIDRDLAGVECLSGIPGLVGATPIQNVGAYGQEVGDILVEVRALDRQSLQEVTFANTECDFAYRQSRFKRADRYRYIIIFVTYRLDPGGPAPIRYPELQHQVGGDASLTAVRNAVLALRRSKSMVIDPRDPNSRSAGSFFLNPVIGTDAFAAIAKDHPDAPNFPAPNGVKVPAAWLVERAGFHKGQTQNGVGISDRHALALVNRDGTTRDLLALADEIQAAVAQTFGIGLEREPLLIEGD